MSYRLSQSSTRCSSGDKGPRSGSASAKVGGSEQILGGLKLPPTLLHATGILNDMVAKKEAGLL